MKKLLVVSLILIFGFGLFSYTTPEQRLNSYEKHLNMVENSIFKNMKWKEVGPYFMGGRITDIEGYNDDPYRFLIATASGGLWLTENNGVSWKSLFNNESCITIGDIAVSQKDKNLIWVGTGEQNSSRSSYAGTGIFKTTDGGKTWKNTGLRDTHHISRIIIDPIDNNVVYVAAIGHLYTDNEERGVFKTTNGGKTWEKVLYISPKTGAIDLVMDPKDKKVLYASMWQRDRKAWNFVESGKESGVYKSVDGGKTWKRISLSKNGFPEGDFVGRIGLSISKSNPNVIYAVVDNQSLRKTKQIKKNASKSDINSTMISKMSNEEFLNLDNKELNMFLRERNVPKSFDAEKIKSFVRSGMITPVIIAQMIEDANTRLTKSNVIGAEVYRSNDKGKTWFKTHDKCLSAFVFSTYGYYFGQIRVSPDDENKIYIMGVFGYKSTNGGKTWEDFTTQGGMYGINGVHADSHAMWIDPNNPKRILLGNDGGLNISYDEGKSWDKINNIPLAQSYTVSYDFEKPYNVYTGLQDNGVNFGPSNYTFGDRFRIWKMILGGDGAFVYPAPKSKCIVFAEFQFGNIFRINKCKKSSAKFIQPKSKDFLHPYRFNWLTPFFVSQYNPFTIILGANKVLKSVDMGDHWIEISPDLTDKKNIDGDVPYATITALSESPLMPEILYAGTDDGNLWVTKDFGKNWIKINNGLPKKWVTRIYASKFKKSRVYVSLTGYREDDFTTYVYVSEDFGKTWNSIKSNLPDEPVNVIAEDFENENILYLGTDLAVYISIDRGKTWYSLKGNLPTIAVYDLKVHPRENDLIIATHGRGIYILNLDKIKKLNQDILNKKLFVFEPEIKNHESMWGFGKSMLITYYSKDKSDIKLIIKKGKKVVWKKELKSKYGINSIEWNMKTIEGKSVDKGDYLLKIYSKKEVCIARIKI